MAYPVGARAAPSLPHAALVAPPCHRDSKLACVVFPQVAAAVVAAWSAAGGVWPDVASSPGAWRQKRGSARCARPRGGCANGDVFVGCRPGRKPVGRQLCREHRHGIGLQAPVAIAPLVPIA